MDEPTFKSTFKTTLVRPSQGGYIALSNMPEESTLEDHPGLATNSIFLCFLFAKKSLIHLEGKSMTPRRGNTILFRSSQQLPSLRLGPLNSPCVLLPELQRYKDTVRCTALGVKVLGHC